MRFRRLVASVATAGLLGADLAFSAVPAQAVSTTQQVNLIREKSSYACQFAQKNNLTYFKKRYVSVRVLEGCHYVKQPGYVGMYEARIIYSTSETSA